MAPTDDDVIASWRDRVGTLPKRGRIGAAALAVVPAGTGERYHRLAHTHHQAVPWRPR